MWLGPRYRGNPVTSGSWSTPNTHPMNNTDHYKIWSGADRPKVISQKPEPYYIYRDGKQYRIVPRRYSSRPVKRARDEPHPYTMSWRNVVDQVAWLPDYDPWTCAAVPEHSRGWYLTHNYRTSQSHDNGLDLTQSQLTSNDQIKLVGKLREKLTGSDFNASVFLGESKQTLGLIADSATRIYRAMRSLKRGNVGHAANILVTGTARESSRSSRVHRAKALNAKTVGSAWLELQYGWLPLVKDAAAGAEQLAHALEVPFRSRKQVSTRRISSTTKVFPKNPDQLCGLYWSYNLHTESRASLIVYQEEDLSVAATLGLLNPENVAWELVPWSFVVDWFIPIGQYLDARAVTSCVNGKYVQSTKTAFRVTGHAGNLEWGADRVEGVDFTRTVSSSPDLPLPKFKSLAQAASWQHCANTIALLSSGAWGSGKARVRN